MINNYELKDVLDDNWTVWTEDNFDENEALLAEITEEDIDMAQVDKISYYLY